MIMHNLLLFTHGISFVHQKHQFMCKKKSIDNINMSSESIEL